MGRQLMVQNLASRNENWIQTWDTVMRWRHVSQKYYSKNMSLMLLWNIGLADVKLAKLHKLGAMTFKTPEGSCHLNYTYLHQRLLSIQAFIQPLFSTAIFSQRLISLMFAESVGHRGENFLKFGSPDCWKMYFRHISWPQTTHGSSLINTISPHEYYGLVIK